MKQGNGPYPYDIVTAPEAAQRSITIIICVAVTVEGILDKFSVSRSLSLASKFEETFLLAGLDYCGQSAVGARIGTMFATRLRASADCGLNCRKCCLKLTSISQMRGGATTGAGQ